MDTGGDFRVFMLQTKILTWQQGESKEHSKMMILKMVEELLKPLKDLEIHIIRYVSAIKIWHRCSLCY